MTASEKWNERAALSRQIGDNQPVSDDKLADLVKCLVGHREAGEDEIFLGSEELASLLKEVLQHRQGWCPSCDREHVVRERVYGYDG